MNIKKYFSVIYQQNTQSNNDVWNPDQFNENRDKQTVGSVLLFTI